MKICQESQQEARMLQQGRRAGGMRSLLKVPGGGGERTGFTQQGFGPGGMPSTQRHLLSEDRVEGCLVS